MNQKPARDTTQLSLLELFRAEVETQTSLLSTGLLEIERSTDPQTCLQNLMRAAHSLKGAARIVNLPGVVRVAHAMEDCLVAAQEGRIKLRQAGVDVLLRSTDLLAKLGRRNDQEISLWESEVGIDLQKCLDSLSNLVKDNLKVTPSESTNPVTTETPAEARTEESRALPAPLLASHPEAPERVVRLTADSLNRLLGLAGESLVESRWIRPFADSLQGLKRRQTDLTQRLTQIRQDLDEQPVSEPLRNQFNRLAQELADSRQFLAERMQELEVFDQRSAQLSHRLYLEVLRTRMRPFGDGVRRFPRMVRDLARALGKQVRLEITGESTQVDRDILERLEMPLAHLFRNAVDHGCEPPGQRIMAGKPPECTIRLDARHNAGMLVVTLSDDGNGVATDRVRNLVIDKGLARAGTVNRLTDSELLQFLFLPGFTLRDSVTEISGRGVGLDVVQNMVRSVRGAIRLHNQPGKGLRIQLQLPLTLSVVRALLVRVDEEPYAIPLSQIQRALRVHHTRIDWLEGRHHFRLDEQQIGLLPAHWVLGSDNRIPEGEDLAVVVLGNRNNSYGLVVDEFLGERELVVQPLDPRLGKVEPVSAAALMEDGAPVLILDVEEIMHSVERLLRENTSPGISREALSQPVQRIKRILAVDDSLTVRELERKILTQQGYLADVAIDGVDAWNAVRTMQYDLLITDLDMPRMDGLQLVRLIKEDARLQKMPVLIVSYKESDLDRFGGLELGADGYLTKGSFDDISFIQAVANLIGEPVVS